MPRPPDTLQRAWQCHQEGDLARAVPLYREAVRLDPDSAEAHYGLGNALMVLGRFAEAAACYEHTLRARPDHAEAHNNRAVARAEQGQFEAAVAGYREALRLRPDYTEAHFNLGNALRQSGDPAAAAASYEKAVELRPYWAEAQTNLGLALARQGLLGQAIARYQYALRLDSDYAIAHNNLGLALQTLGRLDDALAHFDQALKLQPEFAEAHSNRAQLWMLRGHYRRGWPEYEWRWRLPNLAPRPDLPPPWDGGPLDGRRILLWTEQGVGDTLQFIRYAPLVKRMGGRLVVEAPESLLPLLRTCPGVDEWAARSPTLPACDVHAPLLTVPGLLGVSVATAPAGGPYLAAEPERVARWRRVVGDGGIKVGIAWRGSPKYPSDLHRSIPLRAFEPLARVPGVRLVSLQKGPGVDEVTGVADRLAVTELPGLDDSGGAFVDTAAVMMSLDLVITADTAAGHLAGALGRPVWLALPLIPDWRWLLGRDDSPWYPTARLFRQTTLDRWDDVFERMAAALAAGRPG
jgi:tetratricopeptide (TPR) repeat protein